MTATTATGCLLTDPVVQADVASRRSVQWVSGYLDRDLTLPEQALVLIVCAMERCGPYDIDGWGRLMRPHGIGVRFSLGRHASLSTVDSDGLTRGVFQALDLGARLSVKGCGAGRIEVLVHLRAYRGDHLGLGCPTPEQALAKWRAP